jgi:bacillithiol disulfide reductase
MPARDLLIVGAGPSGLAAAIAAKEHGLDYQIIEKGVLVNSIFHFPPQMVFFTTPELLEVGGVPLVSPYEKPTRVEALRYYRRVADAFDLSIVFGEEVVSIEREPDDDAAGEHLFVLESASPLGVRRARHARHVLLATGYYDFPNLLGIPGEALPHVHHYYSEPYPFYRKRVVVVGGGNSAAESALELYRAGALVTLVHRHAELKSTIKYWVRPDIENRIKEGSVAARLNACVTEIRTTSVVVRMGGVEGTGGPSAVEELPADAVFLLTGYHPNWDLMVSAGVALNDRMAPVLDPESFESNVPGLYVAGGALAGRDTGNIFIENGRFHGRRVVEAIVARMSSAPDARRLT